MCVWFDYVLLSAHPRPHNPFGDPSFVWLTSNSQYHVHRYTQAKITLFFCNSTSLRVARCCVAACDDNDDVAYSSSYVYPVLAVSDICADCFSKMFTSASMDQLNVFVFRRVCATVFRAKKNYVYVARLDRDSSTLQQPQAQSIQVCRMLIRSLVVSGVVLVLLVVLAVFPF